MDGFKSIPKMQCFKEGGAVYKSRKSADSADIAQDKAIVKKAIRIHDEQEHKGEHTDLSKLKKGGRAKKSVGTVKKYKAGGSVDNVYGAKKKSGDLDNIEKTKQIKAAKLCGGGKYAEGGSFLDTVKSAGKKLYENVVGTPEQNKTAQENLDKQATEGSKLAKMLGGKTNSEPKPAAKKRGGKVC